MFILLPSPVFALIEDRFPSMSSIHHSFVGLEIDGLAAFTFWPFRCSEYSDTETLAALEIYDFADDFVDRVKREMRVAVEILSAGRLYCRI